MVRAVHDNKIGCHRALELLRNCFSLIINVQLRSPAAYNSKKQLMVEVNQLSDTLALTGSESAKVISDSVRRGTAPSAMLALGKTILRLCRARSGISPNHPKVFDRGQDFRWASDHFKTQLRAEHS